MAGFAEARKKMVDSQLRTEDVTDPNVITAMGDVPRERFVPARLRDLAYIDSDQRIREQGASEPARYLMESAPFARLLQLAEFEGTELVLDIGSGTGYSAAVLARLAESVVALEPDPDLAEQASEVLAELEADNAVVVTGPMAAGYPNEAPYDVVLLGGSVAAVPEALFEQLKDGGRLIAVLGHGRAGQATIFTKSDGDISSRTAFDADIPPLPGFEKAPEFVF